MSKKKVKVKKFITLGGSENPIAYCHYHKKTLSKQQMESKKCLEKECNRLEKYLDNDFWIKRDKQKALSKELRQKRKQREKENVRRLDKSRLVKAIDYCHNCPKGRDKALEYCSQCPYGEECMAGIMDMIYDYFHHYEYDTFEEFLNRK